MRLIRVFHILLRQTQYFSSLPKQWCLQAGSRGWDGHSCCPLGKEEAGTLQIHLSRVWLLQELWAAPEGNSSVEQRLEGGSTTPQHEDHKKEHQEHPTGNGLTKPRFSALTEFPWVMIFIWASSTSPNPRVEGPHLPPRFSPRRRSEPCSPSVGLANSLGTAAPSPSSTGSSSVLTPSICTSCSPEIPSSSSSSSDLELSPVRRNFTTLRAQKLPLVLPGVSPAGICAWWVLKHRLKQVFFLVLCSPKGMLGFVFGFGFGHPALGWDLILGFGHGGCFCAVHDVIKPPRS